MTTDASIRIENMSFSYANTSILQNVNLTVDAGEFICVVGPNGGGKTTLLKAMLGLIKPTKGTITISGLSPLRARPLIGYVPQYFPFDSRFPVRTLDVVLMGRLRRGLRVGPYSRQDKAAARHALHDVGLDEVRAHPFSVLSGGQRQRVLIARALVSEPAHLFLDEPTANIDTEVHGEFHALLNDLNQRVTIVMVTHDTGFVSTLARRVVCVNRTVVVHPTSDITGEQIFELYGNDVTMVRHDKRYREGGRECQSS